MRKMTTVTDTECQYLRGGGRGGRTCSRVKSEGRTFVVDGSIALEYDSLGGLIEAEDAHAQSHVGQHLVGVLAVDLAGQ